MQPEMIRLFEKLGKGDANIAGGKGASLGEMTKAGIPVPPGFVILVGAFERFLAEADLNQEIEAILGGVKHEDIATIEHASEKIRALITEVDMPKDIAREIAEQFRALKAEYVAVRSSATAEDGA
ncbi:MAG: PEP/pyruvate-binding domain-containing protein, partial [Minisyncoccia bacterium]